MMVRSRRASIPPITPGTIALVACAPPALPWSPVVPQQLEAKFCRNPGHWSCHCQLVDVPPIALTLLAVHGCPMAGYTVCSSVLTEVACDKVVFQEICLTNEVARYREVTRMGKVPIFGKVVSAVAFMVNLLLQQTCLPAIKVPTLQMCRLVAVDAHASLLLFRFNTVVAETRLLLGVDVVIAKNYSQLPWSCCLGISRSCPGVSQGSKHLFP